MTLLSYYLIGLIQYHKYEYVPAEEWYVKKAARDIEARKTYFSSERNNYIKGDLYITQILDEEMKIGDLRLR